MSGDDENLTTATGFAQTVREPVCEVQAAIGAAGMVAEKHAGGRFPLYRWFALGQAWQAFNADRPEVHR